MTESILRRTIWMFLLPSVLSLPLLESRGGGQKCELHHQSAKKKDEDKLMFTVTCGFDLLLSRYQLCAQCITGKKGGRLLFYVTCLRFQYAASTCCLMLNVVDFHRRGRGSSVEAVHDAGDIEKEATSGSYQNRVLENNEKIFQEQIELFWLFLGNTKLSDEQRWGIYRGLFYGMSLRIERKNILWLWNAGCVRSEIPYDFHGSIKTAEAAESYILSIVCGKTLQEEEWTVYWKQRIMYIFELKLDSTAAEAFGR